MVDNLQRFYRCHVMKWIHYPKIVAGRSYMVCCTCSPRYEVKSLSKTCTSLFLHSLWHPQSRNWTGEKRNLWEFGGILPNKGCWVSFCFLAIATLASDPWAMLVWAAVCCHLQSAFEWIVECRPCRSLFDTRAECRDFFFGRACQHHGRLSPLKAGNFVLIYTWPCLGFSFS